MQMTPCVAIDESTVSYAVWAMHDALVYANISETPEYFGHMANAQLRMTGTLRDLMHLREAAPAEYRPVALYEETALRVIRDIENADSE